MLSANRKARTQAIFSTALTALLTSIAKASAEQAKTMSSKKQRFIENEVKSNQPQAIVPASFKKNPSTEVSEDKKDPDYIKEIGQQVAVIKRIQTDRRVIYKTKRIVEKETAEQRAGISETNSEKEDIIQDIMISASMRTFILQNQLTLIDPNIRTKWIQDIKTTGLEGYSDIRPVTYTISKHYPLFEISKNNK